MKIKTNLTFRHIFQARPGYCFFSCDFSGEEARLVAALSKEENLEKTYVLEKEYELGIKALPLDPNGKPYSDPLVDTHIVSGGLLSNEVQEIIQETPWLANKNHPVVKKYRQLGKTFFYALIYGASSNKLAAQSNTTKEDIEVNLLPNYFRYPDGFYNLKSWMETVAEIAARQRWIKTPLGSYIMVNESNAKGIGGIAALKRKAVNAYCQATGSDILKLFTHYIYKDLKPLYKEYKALLNGRTVLFNNASHDEVNAEIPGFIKVKFHSDDKKPDITKFKEVLNPEEYSNKLIPYGCVGTELEEFKMTEAFAECIKQSMERAEGHILNDILGSKIPPKADVALSKFWLH